MYRKSNFRPNLKGSLSKRTGFTVDGRPKFSDKVEFRFSMIRLETIMETSSIRADKSGTKSRAQEQVRVGRILIEPSCDFDLGDRLEIHGENWKVTSKYPRHDQVGLLHHYQVDIATWV